MKSLFIFLDYLTIVDILLYLGRDLLLLKTYCKINILKSNCC